MLPIGEIMMNIIDGVRGVARRWSKATPNRL